MGGNFSLSYQNVDVSTNGKWLILPDCNAYINIKAIVFFIVENNRITFKLVDNDNDNSTDGWYSHNGRPVSKFQTIELTETHKQKIIDALIGKEK